MTTRTLVVGGSGFLGAHVVDALIERGFAARPGEPAATIVASRAPAPPSRAASWRGKVRGRVFDATRAGEAERLCDEVRPGYVLCCAALSDLRTCTARPDLARALNAELPRQLARWCAAHRARLVHVSTDLVFGGAPPPPRGYQESSPCSPLSSYGRSKAEGEALVLEADPRALVVRLPLLYGDSGGTGRGASDALLAAVARGERPTLFTDERRSPLDARNAAEALVELLGHERSGLLHLAGPDRLTRFDLGLLVLCAEGRRPDEAVRLIRGATRAEARQAAERPADCCLDASLARSFLATELLPVALALADADEAG